MKELDILTISKVGQSTFPKWWRDASGLAEGGVVEVRPMRDGKNSIVLTPRPAKKRGAAGLLKQFSLSDAHPHARAPFASFQMSFLIDTDLLSMLERKQVSPKLNLWIQQNESDIFLSVVSLAELQFGVDRAPSTHRPSLTAWLSETRRKLAPATEELSEAVLVRWKQLLAELKTKNRSMTCEDSLIAATALHHGHILATHNTRHFEPAGLQIVDPLA